MDADQMQALNDLVDFAERHAREVYGQNEAYEYGTRNGDAILESARIARTYLDGDQNEDDFDPTCAVCERGEEPGHEH